MAISKGIIDSKLNELIDNIERNPELRGQYIEELREYILKGERQNVKDAKRDVVLTMCHNLYSRDYVALKRDLAKIVFCDARCDAKETLRYELLRCLLDSIDIYVDGDYSILFNPTQNILDYMEMTGEFEEDLPFN